MSLKFAVLTSTGGSVVRALMQNTNIRFDLIITDRECGAEALAEEFGTPLIRISDKNNLSFSNKLLKVLKENDIDYVFIFFTRLISGEILAEFDKRLINFHPSLLPACPGMNGFEDSIKSGAIKIGSTIHFIDSGVDTGSQIIQMSVNRIGMPVLELRHIVFAQQVAGLYEVIQILNSKRLHAIGKDITVLNADYSDYTFSSPKLSDESTYLYKKIMKRDV